MKAVQETATEAAPKWCKEKMQNGVKNQKDGINVEVPMKRNRALKTSMDGPKAEGVKEKKSKSLKAAEDWVWHTLKLKNTTWSRFWI